MAQMMVIPMIPIFILLIQTAITLESSVATREEFRTIKGQV